MSTCGIYKFENNINHQIYIGQSFNIERRYKDHISRSKNQGNYNTEYNSIIHKAIRKYGIENFSFSIIEVCKPEQSILNEREKFWIAYYDSFYNGYNATSGGEAAESSRKITEKLANQIKYDLINGQESYDILHEKYNISTGRISEINTGKLWYDPSLSYPLRNKNKIISAREICPKCGGRKDKEAELCLSCYKKTLIKPISRDELKKLIRTVPFTTIGNMYNVTDNSIRKWCKSYNLPFRKKDINSISEKDWEQI